jgi:hypothetical protein
MVVLSLNVVLPGVYQLPLGGNGESGKSMLPNHGFHVRYEAIIEEDGPAQAHWMSSVYTDQNIGKLTIIIDTLAKSYSRLDLGNLVSHDVLGVISYMKLSQDELGLPRCRHQHRR